MALCPVRWRPLVLGLTCWGVCASSAALWQAAGVRLVLNLTPSLPRGVYLVRPLGQLTRGTLVVFQPAAPVAAFLVARQYLPAGVPLLKPLAGLPGDTVCLTDAVQVNGVVLTTLRAASDQEGRPLPHWTGCHLLGTEEVFLLAPQHARSFDGRYFGPVSRHALQGVAVPVWTWESG